MRGLGIALLMAGCGAGEVAGGLDGSVGADAGAVAGADDAAPLDAGPDAAPLLAIEERDLGEVAYGSNIDLAIPDRTLGFTLLATAASPDTPLGVARLESPGGAFVIDDFAIAGSRPFVDVGLVAAAVPETDLFADALPVRAGVWRVLLAADPESAPPARLTLWIRRSDDGAFHGGVVDVHLYAVPGAWSPGYLEGVLALAFDGRFAGLRLGTLTRHDLTADHAVVDDDAELRAMLAATSGAVPAVNVFAVSDLADAAFGGARGVAGGSPGTPMRHGTRRSGVAFTPSADPAYDATVLLHEMGHLAGLFHTVEMAEDVADPLSDTPACPAATLAADPASCPDAANLMFPIAYGGDALSAAQLRVLEGSLIHHAGAASALPSPPPAGARPGSADPRLRSGVIICPSGRSGARGDRLSRRAAGAARRSSTDRSSSGPGTR